MDKEQQPEMQKPSATQRLKQVLRFALFLGVGILIIWLFQRSLTEDEKGEVWQAMLHANGWMLVLLIIFGIISNVFRTLRWNLLINPMGYKPRFHNTFMSICVGYFANLAIPRLGEVLRCTFMQRYEKVPFQKSLGTVITERALDMICFLLLFLGSFIAEYTRLKAYVWEMFSGAGKAQVGHAVLVGTLVTIGVFACVCAGLVIYYRRHRNTLSEKHWLKRIAYIFNGFGEGIMSLKHVARPWAFVLDTLGIWACYWMMMFFAFHSIAGLEHTGVGLALIAMAMGTIGTIVTPGGIGLYPVIISATLGIFEYSDILGYSAGWIAWGTQTMVIILAGIFSMVLLPLVNKR